MHQMVANPSIHPPTNPSVRPSTQLLYVTPEQLVQSGALRDVLTGLQQRGRLARFVIDEVGRKYLQPQRRLDPPTNRCIFPAHFFASLPPPPASPPPPPPHNAGALRVAMGPRVPQGLQRPGHPPPLPRRPHHRADSHGHDQRAGGHSEAPGDQVGARVQGARAGASAERSGAERSGAGWPLWSSEVRWV